MAHVRLTETSHFGDDSTLNPVSTKPSDDGAYHFPQFQEFIDNAKENDKDVYGMVIQIIHDVVVLALIVAVLWIPINRVYSSQQESKAIAMSEREVGKWPQSSIVGELNADQQYNAKIAQSGQPLLGDKIDPFSNDDSHKDLQSANDKDYQARLNTVEGIMGTIRIPKISVKLPIYHGTSDTALAQGAGHLYGTSLPVGGASTNAVISGHRGLANATMFTRLDELRVHDIIYIDSLQHTMGYRVIGIHVILPDDTHLYKVVPGKDLITLMTCTPYGVNSHRLVITAERGRIPEDIPSSTAGDALLLGLLTTAAVLLGGVAIVMVRHARYNFSPVPWHFSGEFSR
ncbi:class C sortase [Bifidobacterium sp. ESL0728]|uniref:class C sortase n=1 Tax=Bifidobacterium sp. ESL0728 TaxID=2983220 RepID=UPI0023F98E51|nr:class C sortase [Bifidobacterium sp. ESL0728]WEV59103.1 class C sortase [Bifidobacterium sp. ESL0728]